MVISPNYRQSILSRYLLVAAGIAIIAPIFLYAIGSIWDLRFPFGSATSAMSALDRNSESYVIFKDRFGSERASHYTLFVTNFFYLNTTVTLLASISAGSFLALMKFDFGNDDFNPTLTCYATILAMFFCVSNYYLVFVPLSGEWAFNFPDYRAKMGIYGQELSLAYLSSIFGLLGVGLLWSELFLKVLKKLRNWTKKQTEHKNARQD